MNIFFIPSWYPSPSHPLPGIFFRDQALALGLHFPDLNIGISVWGQNDERMLLWAKQPVRSLGKHFTNSGVRPGMITLAPNVVEFHTPTFTWTEKVFEGNMKRIIEANDENLRNFESKHGKPAVIHAHVGYPAGVIARKLSEVHGIPYVITEQMSPFPHRQFCDVHGRPNEKLIQAYGNSAVNIAISEAQEESMRIAGVTIQSIIPNLVDDLFFRNPCDAADNEKFTFFSLGRMVPQKGIDILLNAFARVKTDCVLRIGGDGEGISEYKQLADKLGIAAKVFWLGELTREQAANEFQLCNAFVLPSRHESMGLVFAEAMACGRPVIASFCGGPEEFVYSSIGILVETDNINQLVLAMELMVATHSSFSAHKIRETCRALFSSKVICGKIMYQYRRVIEEHR